MGVIKEDAYFVVADYKFESVDSFDKVFVKSEACKDYVINFNRLKLEKFKINGILIDSNVPPPIAIYQNNNKDEIRYNFINQNLEIVSRNYDKNKESYYSEMLKTLCSFKLQEISNIGLNFLVNYDTGSKKLNIFNKNIRTGIEDFPKNIGFHVTLPMDLKEDFEHDCVGTYDISKINNSANENYVYAIVANYNFKLIEDKANPIKRFEELQKIINIIPDIYKKFEKTYNEIVKL